MAAKQVAVLIPLCHQVNLSSVSVDFAIDKKAKKVLIEATAQCAGQTGVEMEAMTGASVGALTLYDMIKGLDRGAQVGPVRLVAKSGGRSGEWTR